MDKRTLRTKKARPRNARPYDRQNQSFFGRVFSTVKGLLNPINLFNVPQWMDNSEEQHVGSADNIEEETVREDNDVVYPSVSHGNKRLRLRFEDRVPSIQSSGTQTCLEQSTQNLYDPISHVQSPSTQSSLLENKETMAVLNGDDHSENSEGSASTSGCSSLVSSHKESNRLAESPFGSLLELKNSRKRKLSSSKLGHNDLGNRSLWSNNSSPKFQRRLPTISHTNQPSFNLSTFGGPSKLNESVEKKVSSPFYEGRTTFGGASASRRLPLSVAPYQVDKSFRNKIQIRDHNSNDNLEGMSSAAKRILLTLEKMSSPVVDAKKIPNSGTSPIDMSLYLTPPKSRRNSQFTPSIASKGPPIADVNTIAELATLKNYGTNRLRTSFQGPSLNNSKIENSSLLPKSFVFSSPVEPELRSSSNTLPKENIPITTSCNSRSEKKVDMPPKPFVFSNPIQLELPNIPLPRENVTLSSNLDSKFKKNSDLQPKSFVFSSPIEHELPNNNALHKENISLPVTTTTSACVSPLLTWECSACWVRNSITKTSCAACETPKVAKDTSSVLKFKRPEETKSSPVVSMPVSVSSTGFNFGNSVPLSSFSSSSPFFTFGTSKTESQKVSPSKPLTFGSGSSVTWECDACWVRNPETDIKCKACETPRTQKKSQDKTSSTVSNVFSTWECASCWVRNPVKENKCMACEALRPNADKTSDSTTHNVPSTWECTSCWVRNPMKEKKCMACETLHPNADKTPGFAFKGIEKNKNTSSASLTTQTATTTVLNADISASSAPVGFAFGIPKSDAQNAFVQNFSFGSGVASKSEATTSVSVSTTQSVTSGVDAGIKAPASSGGFVFGVPKADSQNSTTPFAFGSGPEKPQSTLSVSPTTSESAPGLNVVTTTASKISASFVFGNLKNDAQNTTIPISFGSDLGKNPAAPSVSSSKTESATEEKNVSTSTAVSSGGFVFGAPKTDDPASVAAPFAFGSGFQKPQSTPSVTFSASETPTQNVNTSAAPLPSESFVFGNSKIETQNTSVPFSFGSGLEKSQSTPAVSSSTCESTAGVNVVSASAPKLSENFVFGNSKTEAQTKTVPFSFGSGFGKTQTPPSVSSSVSQSATGDQNVSTSVAVSSGGFVFGAPKSEAQTSVAAPFAFGSALEKPQSAPSVSSSISESTPGLNVSTSTPKPTESFVFGGSKAETQKTVPFSFGSGLGSAQTTAPVSSSVSQSATRDLNIPTSTAVSAGGFVFGVPKTEVQTSVAPPFVFGSGATSSSSNTSAFSAFQPSQLANPTFKFGGTPVGSTVASFSFAKNETSSQIPSSVPQNPVSAFGSTSTNFVFGSKSDAPIQIPNTVSQALSHGFGSTANFTFSGKSENNTSSQNPAPTFRSSTVQSVFGTTPAQSFGGTDKPASSGLFNFGATTPSVFQFGASNTTEKKRSAPTPGFSFGTPSAPETNNSFATGFTINTPPSFNFGATSTPSTVPFQFAASTAPKPAPGQSAPRKYKKAVRRVTRRD